MNSRLFFNQIYRECLIQFRKPLTLIYPWIFFILTVILFPLSLSQNLSSLAPLAPGIIWIAALLAYLLSLERFFEADFHNGSLEYLLIYPLPLPLSVLAKMTAHWLQTGIPLIGITPFLANMLRLPLPETLILMLSLCLGTPVLSALGALLGAVTITLASRGLLLSILLIPLAIPVFIFGTGSVTAHLHHLPSLPGLLFLAALSIISLVTLPFAAAAALRLE